MHTNPTLMFLLACRPLHFHERLVSACALHSPPWINLNWLFCLAVPNKSCRAARDMLCCQCHAQASSPDRRSAFPVPASLDSRFPRKTALAHHLRAMGDTETLELNMRTWGKEYPWAACSKRQKNISSPTAKAQIWYFAEYPLQNKLRPSGLPVLLFTHS